MPLKCCRNIRSFTQSFCSQEGWAELDGSTLPGGSVRLYSRLALEGFCFLKVAPSLQCWASATVGNAAEVQLLPPHFVHLSFSAFACPDVGSLITQEETVGRRLRGSHDVREGRGHTITPMTNACKIRSGEASPPVLDGSLHYHAAYPGINSKCITHTGCFQDEFLPTDVKKLPILNTLF